VSFLEPLEGGEEVSFLNQCPRLTVQPDDTDYITKLMEKEQFQIRICGGVKEQKRYLAWKKERDQEERERQADIYR
jgi:selenophosphate synthetase-related protein